MTLSPEEREKIYEEEKARREAQDRLTQEQTRAKSIPTQTTERRATFTEKNGRMVLAAIVGLGMFVGGLLLLLIPVLGWIFGSIFIMIGVLFFFCSPALLVLPLRTIEGPCPYCGHLVVAFKGEKAKSCSVCKSRVIVHPGCYCPVGV